MRGIYVHVPFCARKCAYCDFYSVVAGEEAMERYCGLLLRELEIVLREFPREAEPPADTVYFGGGTPSLLGPVRLRRLLSGIRSRLPVEKTAEVTLEANPGTLQEEDFPRLLDAGFTRLSLGVQSFRPAVLAALGRIHSARDARDAFRRAREARFPSVGIDLIFGTPGQEEADWEEELREAAALRPDHISAYVLTPEPGTPLHGRLERGEIALPSDDATASMYYTARRRLAAAGYLHYEISNFALPGQECRHNGKYWRREGYLGLGPSAHGLLFPGISAPMGMRTANPASLEEYASRVGEERIPWAEAEARSREDAWREFLIFGLRVSEGVSPEEGEKRHGPLPERLSGAVERLVASGGLVRDRGRLRIPEAYWFVSNEVLRKLA
ncbi:MAG: radical SAM family heme chaperone HemW [Thermodesulfobacteriota bacterium]